LRKSPSSPLKLTTLERIFLYNALHSPNYAVCSASRPSFPDRIWELYIVDRFAVDLWFHRYRLSIDLLFRPAKLNTTYLIARITYQFAVPRSLNISASAIGSNNIFSFAKSDESGNFTSPFITAIVLSVVRVYQTYSCSWIPGTAKL
jgi:hypothetical protein